MNINSTLLKFGNSLVKNSPAVLTVAGAVGVVTTSVLAVKATPKALMLIEEYRILEAEQEDIKPENVVVKPIDAIQLCWREYFPAVSIGVLTIGCIVGSHSIHVQRQAALLGAYTLAEKSLTDYKSAAKEILTDHQVDKVQNIADQKLVNADPLTLDRQVILTGSGDQLCYETWTGRYFKSDIETIRKAMNDINSEINAGSYASLNQFFDLIGLTGTTGGSEVGWTTDHKMELNFSTVLSPDNKPCLSIGYSNKMPVPRFDELSHW